MGGVCETDWPQLIGMAGELAGTARAGENEKPLQGAQPAPIEASRNIDLDQYTQRHVDGGIVAVVKRESTLERAKRGDCQRGERKE
jgi:hypothetical protein